jgi:hypothetical protein
MIVGAQVDTYTHAPVEAPWQNGGEGSYVQYGEYVEPDTSGDGMGHPCRLTFSRGFYGH